MRILALVTDGFGAPGGIARYNQALLGVLAGLDQVAEVVVAPRFGTPPAPALPRLRQLPAAPGKPAYLARSATLAAHARFDLVFCGHLHMALLGMALARRWRCPCWLQVHGIEAFATPGRLVRRAVERTDLVTAVSRHTRRRVLAWSDLAPERVRVLPNVLGERFAPGPPPPGLVRRYDLVGRRVLLTVGRLAASERYKGHDRVIAALPYLARRWPDLVYVIAGDGDDRPRLERLAADEGVADRVRFTGPVPEADLPGLYRLARLFVMPSTGEGFGIVFLEAMASGVAALGGDQDGSRDPLQDGALGTITPVERTAEALERLLDEPPPDGPALARAVRARFGPALFARQVQALVDHLRGAP